jgi:hypothetical protein
MMIIKKFKKNFHIKNVLFSRIRPNPKDFSYIFSKKDKIVFLSCFKKCKNRYHNQFMIIIMVWSKYQKSHNNYFLIGALGFSCRF